MFVKLSALLLILFFVMIPVNDVNADIFSWALNGSIFYFPADNGVDSDPAPVIASGGFSLAWQFARFFKVEFTEDIYFTNYEFNSALGYPMACNPENRSAFVLGFVTGIQATGFFPIGDRGTAVRIFGGPAADLRVVILALGLNHPSDFTGNIATDARLQTNAIRKYFWGQGRWFMPVAGIGMDFPINEKFLIGFDLRAWFPVYKLWTNDNTPAIDGWRFGAGVRITPRVTRHVTSGDTR